MNKENVGLYNQSFEHDNCGIGAVVNIKGLKTYKTVDDALKIVEQLEHRAGKDADDSENRTCKNDSGSIADSEKRSESQCSFGRSNSSVGRKSRNRADNTALFLCRNDVT